MAGDVAGRDRGRPVLAWRVQRTEDPWGTGGFIAGVDGLKGWPQAIETVYRHTQVQWCVVHPVRNRLRDVPLERSQAGRR